MQNFINEQIKNYSMCGNWRKKYDREILDEIALMCQVFGLTHKQIMEDIKDMIFEALNKMPNVIKYSHTPGNPPIIHLAENAAYNIYKRL